MEISKKTLALSLVGICSLNIVASIDTTALSVAIPTISIELDASTVEAYWTGIAFLLASSVFQPIFGALSVGFGRKTMALAALLIFTAGTIVCGTAARVGQLIAGRAIQGLGGGGLLVMTYIIMADLLSLRNRANGIALLSVIWLLGTSTGPIMGGGFTADVTWRWIFWFALPFVGISIFLITFFLETPHRKLQPVQAIKGFDWIGATIFVGSLTSFLVAISWGGGQFSWSSYHTLVPLIVGAVGLLTWVAYEYYVPKAPMIPLGILRTRTAAVAFGITTIMGIVQFGQLYYLPLYYETSKGYSSLISGVALLPNALTTGVTTGVSGTLISKTGKYRFVMWIGWIALSLGCGLLVLLDTQTSIPAWIFINIPSGIGLGCLYSSLGIAVQAPQEAKHMGLASGLIPFFRSVGQSLGIAIGNGVYQSVLRDQLATAASTVLREQANQTALKASSLVVIVEKLGRGSREARELLSAFNTSLHALWWTLTGLSLFSGAMSLLVLELSLDRSKPELEKDLEKKISQDEEKGKLESRSAA